MEILTVRGNLKSISRITAYVNQAAEQAGLSERTTYYLCLAVDEIATNVIMHGYQAEGKQGNLSIWAEADADILRICLEDTGQSYDPRQVPPPDLQRPLHEREPGGLGIYLALRSVDKFQYQQCQGRNRSTFIIQKPRNN